MMYLLGLSDCVRYYYTISTVLTDHPGKHQRLPQELLGRNSRGQTLRVSTASVTYVEKSP
jgi:hypothetical protein